jgi:hypothetical protein
MKLSLALTTLFAGLVGPTLAHGDDEAALRALRGNVKVVEGECSFAGNGFPKGHGVKPVFRLKLLGRDLDRKETWNYDPNAGNSIAVALNGNTKILLENSDADGSDCDCDYCVTDPNGTDGTATLCMKDPFDSSDPCIDGEGPCDEEANFRIFARVRGKGSVDFTTCVEDTTGDFKYCDTGNTVTLNTKRAIDISQQLLTLCYQGSGIGLFDELCFDEDGTTLIKCDGDEGGIDEQYYWDVDNDGVRNAELRFYDQADLDDLYDEAGCTWETVTRGKACAS